MPILPRLKDLLPIVVAAATVMVAGPVSAQAPQLVDSFKDWSLYTYEGGEKLCYIASEPKKQAGTFKKRDQPAILVTRLPGKSVSEEVSVQPGYAFKKDSEAKVAVDGGKGFRFFTQGEHAWANSTADDKALIAQMRKGTNVVVDGTSLRDTTSTDTYSLAGFSAAHDAMAKRCPNGTPAT
jgi:invasion protein IalB